jgi:hypothetical protein
MATYVEINGVKYPASITGRLFDKDWDNRESKAVKVEMSYSDAIALFVDDISWNIVQDVEEIVEEYNEETDEMTTKTVTTFEYFDNSEYSIAGDIVDHRDGTITVKMGKPTAEELLALLEEVL